MDAIHEEEEMAEAGSTLSRHDLEAKIVKRCWEDEAFCKEFTADPAAAFVKYLAVPAASLPRISVHQEEPGSWHIVLPPKPANAAELTEVDLEKVAGGLSEVVIIPFIQSLELVAPVVLKPVASPAVTAATAIVSGGVAASAGVVSGIIADAKAW
jgi:hypothetical protein